MTLLFSIYALLTAIGWTIIVFTLVMVAGNWLIDLWELGRATEE